MSVIALRLELSKEVTPEVGADLRTELIRAIESRASERVVDDDVVWAPRCDSRCADEVRARTGASDVVIVRALAALTILRVNARRTALGAPEREAKVEIAFNASLQAVAETVTRALFPAPPSRASELAEGPDPWRPEPGPLVLAAGGAAVLVAGIALGVSSSSARTAAEKTGISNGQYETLADESVLHAALANAAFVMAAGAVVIAVVWLWAP